MKRKIELTILLLLYALFGYLTINHDPRSHIVILHTVFLFLSAGAFIFGNAFYLMPLLKRKETTKYILLNLILLVFSYFIVALLSSAWMADIGDHKLKASHLIHFASIQMNLPLLLTMLTISVVYTYIRHLFLMQKYSYLKKLSLYTSAAVIVVSLAFYTNYKADISYKGNAEVLLLEQKYTNLEEIVQLPQFQNKVLYVDLWYSSCNPCMDEFENTAEFKEKLKGKNVAFLYMGRETSHPNSMQRWKNVIKKYNLTGWHFYMSKPMASRLWEKIMANQNSNSPAGYPRYLLFDQNGKIVTYDAKKPSDGRAALEEIENVLRQPVSRRN